MDWWCPPHTFEYELPEGQCTTCGEVSDPCVECEEKSLGGPNVYCRYHTEVSGKVTALKGTKMAGGITTGQWCEKHWAPVREAVLAGKVNGIEASIYVFTALTWHEDFQERCGGDSSPAMMTKITEEISPICCYLGDGAISVALAASTVGDE